MKYKEIITIPAAAILLSLSIYTPCVGKAFTLPAGSNSTQCLKFRGSDGYRECRVSFTSQSLLLTKAKEQRECDFIELLSLISASGKPVTEPDPQAKRRYRPYHGPGESDKAGVSIEKKHVFTQREILKILMWGPLSALLMFPLGIIFSTCIGPSLMEKRRRCNRYHALRIQRLKRWSSERVYLPPEKTLWKRIWL